MRQKYQQIFKINSRKIVSLAIIVALYVLLSWISKLINLSIFPAAPFLKIELTDFIFLMALKIIGLFYTLFITIVVSWLRILYLGDLPIDVFALMLADLVFIILFWGLTFLFNKIIANQKNSKKLEYLSLSCALGLATVGVSFIMAFFNWLFILPMYGAFMNYPPEVITWFKGILIPILVPFNLIKFGINGVFFVMIYRAVVIIAQQYHHRQFNQAPKRFPVYSILDFSEELYC
ncbi:ECF transporter S component [Spiroplasma chrysopicola]|uniref:Riboflavin transporter n=1 Tax=Spiroplasma chrysopicola DF-1 TaxID=1276227 RepID=R4UI12_9MOLU|nr:ECF transporter S component [Spiroplasma chrysopicola]AGM24956.1 hypothetical protein SCHRY_v1c03730 [Spiroplasma chrysopicola DF-1]